MDSIVEYLDAAKSRIGVEADWKLSLEMGKSPAWASHMRSGRDWPSDDTMIRLAELAGADPARALLQLNLWRASSPAVSMQYSRLLQRIASLFAIFTLVIGGSYSVQASTIKEHQATHAKIVYIMTFLAGFITCIRRARSACFLHPPFSQQWQRLIPNVPFMAFKSGRFGRA